MGALCIPGAQPVPTEFSSQACGSSASALSTLHMRDRGQDRWTACSRPQSWFKWHSRIPARRSDCKGHVLNHRTKLPALNTMLCIFLKLNATTKSLTKLELLSLSIGKHVQVPHPWFLPQTAPLPEACLLKERIQERTATTGWHQLFPSASRCLTLTSHPSFLFATRQERKLQKRKEEM